MHELTLAELEAETVEVLPAREALGVFRFSYNGAALQAFNTSAALNIGAIDSVALSSASQYITVIQH